MVIVSWIEEHYLAMKPYMKQDPSFKLPDLYPRERYLSLWAKWYQAAQTTQPRLGAPSFLARVGKLGDTGTALSNDIEQFEDDMIQLQQNWNTSLLKNPGIIWDEVTAFTSSRFLIRTLDTKTTTLAPSNLRSAVHSSRPLCLISNTSNDAKYTAVLSIWPSR
jgi:hypothetical protein